jgi:GNAT superfamily N-acetyltransferase
LQADKAPSSVVSIREVAVEAVLPLRHEVLRATRPFDSAKAKQDRDPATLHLAAFVDDSIVGVLTQFPDATSLAPGAVAERFRGMAVAPWWQGRGIGRQLMRAVRDLARARGADLLWANGRDTALPFYESLGFHVVGEGFVDNEMHLGHHVVLARIDERRL